MSLLINFTSINHTLWSAGDNDPSSNAFASTLCFKQVSCDKWSRIQVTEGPNTSDQIVFCAFNSFLA